MSSRHNDILQDDDEFTSLSATSPNDHNYQFYYHQPGSPYDGLGYGALFTLDNANLYSNQRGGAAINNLGKIRDNFSFDRAADQLTRPGLTHNGDQVYHQPVALTYSFLTQSALNRIGQTGDGDKGLQPLTQAAQAQALKSMQAWADVANVTESTVAAFDVIEDFEHGIDKIDLSGLRFNNSLSELRFIDSGSAFSGQKGEIQLNFDAFNDTTDLLMNTQSNSYAADFKIHVVGQVEQSDILFA